MEGKTYKWRPKWANIIPLFLFHLTTVFYFFLLLSGRLKSWKATLIFHLITGMILSQGILAGVHRYYTHRSFKAKLPLRVILVFLNTLAFQAPIWIWSRDHRLHHKYADTDADPHNATRGFFFSHVGWLLVKAHPQAIEKRKTIDLSDLNSDPLVMFQKKYYVPLVLSSTAVFFIWPPMYFWNETLLMALMTNVVRHTLFLNITFLVNSAAHVYGSKPYDTNIRPTENALVSFLTLGEGWHNYHHTFPGDYRAAEFGLHYDFTTKLIDFFAWIGWAYDLKDTSSELVKSRTMRTGDGTNLSAGVGK